jgi:hypothetical protein
MLLVEVVDRVMPLVVRNPASIPADLYRFDTVEFSYDKAQSPGSPVHLVLNESLNPPIKQAFPTPGRLGGGLSHMATALS